MHCPFCGREVPESQFCELCGKSMSIEKTDPGEPRSDTALDAKSSPPAPSVEQSAAPQAKTADEPVNAGGHPRWYGVVWTPLAIVLYLAIADAAGRRMNWATKTAASVVVLSVLLAATAWMPDGLEEGLILFGQTTAAILAVVSAVVVAVALVVELAAVFSRAAATTKRSHMFVRVAMLSMSLVVGLAASRLGAAFSAGAVDVANVSGAGGSGGGSSAQSAAASAQFSNWQQMGAKGPGLRATAAEKLAWTVPRTVDLSYVDPTNFAAALGKDPAKIFSFVRDRIAYEAYPGSLRGPRGTLLAMAGNSVDRAALLAALLQSSGQTVRFAHGTLSDAQAQELIASMWRERARSAVAQEQTSSGSSPDLQAASGALQKNVRRDVTALHDHLNKAGEPTAATVAADPATLMKEAEDHYWVQWSNDGKWTDLDPSFADATPGQTFARMIGTIDTLPSDLFQRVDIHVSIEEYTDGKPSTREVLHYAANAADLSGIDVLLMHRSNGHAGGIATPESVDNKQAGGIGNSIGGLFGRINGTASEDTSKKSQVQQPNSVKPVLVIAGQSPVVGESFQERQQAGEGGGGGLGLGGGGDESTPSGPVATAESVEIDFLAPGRSKETVVRQIFDVVNRQRRGEKKLLKADEVSALTGANQLDLSQAIYDLFFTTGSLDAANFTDLDPADEPTPPQPGIFNAATLLRRVNITFAATSDALSSRLARPDNSVCRLYLDSPRLQIADVTTIAGVGRLTLDLRRDKARAVGNGVGAKELFYAQVLRGVLDGTLERVLVDYINTPRSGARGEGLQSISTSWIMEQGQAESVPLALLRGASSSMPSGITPATTTLLRQRLGDGFLLLAPNRAITLAGAPRLAWWQVDRHSGETIAVTDEGLYQAATEYTIIIDDEEGFSVVYMQSDKYGVIRSTYSGQEVYSFINALRAFGGYTRLMVSWV